MSAFRIDVHNAAGTKLNTITEIGGVSITSRVNRLGELRFGVPQTLATDRGIGRGKVYKLYHRVSGLLGTFYHSSQELDETGSVLSVTCYDQLYELTRKTVGFNWAFSGLTFVQAMDAIADRFGDGWSAATNQTSGSFYDFVYDTSGESYFQLLEQARRSNAGWFALSGDKQFEYGRWLDSRLTDDTPIARFISVASASGWRITQNGDVAIERMTVREDSGTITNRVIAVGQGLGVSQLSLKYSDATSPYTISSRGNWDGDNDDGTDDSGARTREYYIQDSTSISEHGLNEATVQFDIKPVTNSQADLLNAGNALYSAAVAYLLRSRNPLVNYTLTVLGLPASISCGSVVEVDYRDVATVIDSTGAAVRKVKLALNKTRLFVAEISREFDDIGGISRATLTVSTTGETFADQTEIVTDLIRDAKRFKTRVAPSMCVVIDSGQTQAIKSGVDYVMPLKYDAAVLELNAVKFVFTTGPLISYANNSTASGGGSTTSSGGSSTQTSSSGGGTTVTSGSSSIATTAELGPVGAVNNDPQAGYIGFTGYAKGVPNDTAIYSGSGGSGNQGGVSYVDTNTTYGSGSDSAFYQHGHFGSSHTHEITYHYHPVTAHTHGMAHTHTVTISAHSHTVSIPDHTHSVSAHTHDLAFGVIKDSDVPTGVSVWLDGVQITQIKNYDTGTFAGSTVSAEGAYYVSLINALQGMSDWRGSHTVTVKCTGGKGLVAGKVVQRITIQAIAVAGDD